MSTQSDTPITDHQDQEEYPRLLRAFEVKCRSLDTENAKLREALRAAIEWCEGDRDCGEDAPLDNVCIESRIEALRSALQSCQA